MGCCEEKQISRNFTLVVKEISKKFSKEISLSSARNLRPPQPTITAEHRQTTGRTRSWRRHRGCCAPRRAASRSRPVMYQPRFSNTTWRSSDGCVPHSTHPCVVPTHRSSKQTACSHEAGTHLPPMRKMIVLSRFCTPAINTYSSQIIIQNG